MPTVILMPLIFHRFPTIPTSSLPYFLHSFSPTLPILSHNSLISSISHSSILLINDNPIPIPITHSSTIPNPIPTLFSSFSSHQSTLPILPLTTPSLQSPIHPLLLITMLIPTIFLILFLSLFTNSNHIPTHYSFSFSSTLSIPYSHNPLTSICHPSIHLFSSQCQP
jgi:hypothetical protein